MNMMIENYHKHTTWSNLVQPDSATSIEELIKISDSYGCKCHFSGEHGYQGEWLYVYDICKKTNDAKYREKVGITNPLLFRYSTEAYWVMDRHQKDRTNCHMVIIARNYQAMRKVNYILSMAAIDGFYGKPRIDLDLLFELDKEDVFITSACIAGWKYADALDVWLKIWEHFGDSFFFEYQTHNTPQQKELNSIISKVSREKGIQTLIGLDTHYVSEEDKVKREHLLQRKKIKYGDELGWYKDFPAGTEVYSRMIDQGVLTKEEIITAMMNTHIFLNGCENVSLNTDFKIPVLKKYQDYSYQQRADVLKQKLIHNYKNEDSACQTVERYDGMKYEFGEIRDSMTADYFIDNHELVKLAITKYNGHLTTSSRGSASSYYTSKLLGFTTMDRFDSEVPIYPERFITKERVLSSHQMPDIDFNVSEQEPFVLAGKELFGTHGCYPLLAVGKLAEKSGFKLYADIKGISPTVANEISKCIDRYNEAIKQAEDEEDKKNILISDFILDPTYLKIFNDSESYQGIIEQAKVNACGFILFNGNQSEKDVVGYGDIRYEIGLIRCSSKSTGKSTVVACVEGSLLDYYGYVKDDFLIVDVVGITHKLYESIGRSVPSVSELRKMVENDPLTWELYEKGATCSLNQCEKPTTTRRVMKYKPKSIKELSAFIAAIRPGFKSLIEGFLNRIIYSNGEEAIDSLLDDCFHYMLYQEAVMKIFSYLGIGMKVSYDTIKQISKKKLKGEELGIVEKTLRDHWKANIGNLTNFEPVYQVIKDSARYSFNAPHALAMAYDSLAEAWVKAHYTSIFYQVTLNHYQNKGDKNKVSDLMKEAMTIFGYSMGTYEYGKDNSKFTVDDELKIIYPNLSSVKGIGKKVVINMLEIYNSGKDDFVDVYQAIKGTNINASVFKDLIKIGYFKRFGSIKKLLRIVEIYDYWKGGDGTGRKTFAKTQVRELGLENIDLSKFSSDLLKSGEKSQKRYSDLDWVGIVKELAAQVTNEEYGIMHLAKFQYTILGYIDYVDESLDWRYIVITNLDTKYSPKFVAYFLCNGKTAEMKIHKKLNRSDKQQKVSYAETPFEDGDVLYIRSWKRQPQNKKIKDKWVENPDILEKWINDYVKI